MKFIQTIKNNFYFLSHVYEFSKSYVIGEAVVAIIEGISPLIDMIVPKIIIDTLIYDSDFKKIVITLLCYVILQFSCSALCTYITQRYINLNAHLYSMHFLILIRKKTISLDMKQLDQPEIHQKIALAEDIIYKGIGIDMINDVFTAITSIVSIITTALLLVHSNGYLLVVILFFSVFSIYLDLKIENWELSQREENIYLSRILNYYIRIMGDKSCAKEMRIYGFVDWLMKKYNSSLKKLKKRLQLLYQRSLLIQLSSIALEHIKNNGIYLYLAWLAFIKKISIGEFTQYFNAASQFSESIVSFASFFTNLDINGKYISSFRSFMELSPNMKHSSLKETNAAKEANASKKASDYLAAIKQQKKNFTIILKDVCFQYTGLDKPVLNHINFTFQSGKVYAIVGENGVGKTTLIQLLSRLYEPSAGDIFFNDRPIKQFDCLDYRQLFSIVFQDFKYFAFTIGENVALSEYENDTHTRHRIQDCLTCAGLKKKLLTLPKGIDTPLDKIFYQDGIVLSGGENQKLALARALFQDAPILILDEPSSALDPISEDELLHSFQTIAKDKLVLYISHRLSSSVLADEIIFLKDGKIRENGSHKELMRLDKEYAHYYKAQAKYYT